MTPHVTLSGISGRGALRPATDHSPGGRDGAGTPAGRFSISGAGGHRGYSHPGQGDLEFLGGHLRQRGPDALAVLHLPDDFNFLTGRSDVALVALNATDEMAVVHPDGRSRIVLTASNGLASPTDSAVRGTRMFITNAEIATPRDAELLSEKISTETLLGGAAS